MFFGRRAKQASTMTSISPDEFRSLCGLWPTGVSIVTTRDLAGHHFGLTMNSITSVSLEPPLLLVCLANSSETLEAICDSRIFCINLLASDQEDLSRRFASRSLDKFQGVRFSAGQLGAPVIDGVLGAMECRVEDIFPGGDHKIVVGRCVHGEKFNCDAAPLVFVRSRYGAALA
jgi:flavin reductase (DIM6/NTAB) family NADH-FMN oxidoreductase RutF